MSLPSEMQPFFSFFSTLKCITFAYWLEPFYFLANDQGQIEIWHLLSLVRVHSWTAHPSRRSILGLDACYKEPKIAQGSYQLTLTSQAKEDGFTEWQLELPASFQNDSSVSVAPLFTFSYEAVHFCPFALVRAKKWMIMPNALDPSLLDIWLWHREPTLLHCIQSTTKSKNDGICMALATFEWQSLTFLCAGHESGILNIYRLEQVSAPSPLHRPCLSLSHLHSLQLHQASILCLYAQTEAQVLWTSAVDNKIVGLSWRELVAEPRLSSQLPSSPPSPPPLATIITEKGGNGILTCPFSTTPGPLICGAWHGQIDIYSAAIKGATETRPQASMGFHKPHAIAALCSFEWKSDAYSNWPIYYALPRAFRLKSPSSRQSESESENPLSKQQNAPCFPSILVAVARGGSVSLALIENEKELKVKTESESKSK